MTNSKRNKENTQKCVCVWGGGIWNQSCCCSKAMLDLVMLADMSASHCFFGRLGKYIVFSFLQ